MMSKRDKLWAIFAQNKMLETIIEFTVQFSLTNKSLTDIVSIRGLLPSLGKWLLTAVQRSVATEDALQSSESRRSERNDRMQSRDKKKWRMKGQVREWKETRKGEF